MHTRHVPLKGAREHASATLLLSSKRASDGVWVQWDVHRTSE